MTFRYQSSRGFSVIELLLVLSLMGILTVGAMSIFGGNADQAGIDETVAEMKKLKDGLVGNPDVRINGDRSDFGILGHVGAIPDSTIGLEALITRPLTWSPYDEINSTYKFYGGWKGPYIKIQEDNLWNLDAWGRAYVYTTVGTPPTSATITSLGPKDTDPSDDITLNITTAELLSLVQGQLTNNGVPLNSSATLTLYGPTTSAAQYTRSLNLTPADRGVFSFADVPQGRAILVVTPANSGNIVRSFRNPEILLSVEGATYLIPENKLNFSDELQRSVCNSNTILFENGSITNGTTTLPVPDPALVGHVLFRLRLNAAITLKKVNISWAASGPKDSLGVDHTPVPGTADSLEFPTVSQLVFDSLTNLYPVPELPPLPDGSIPPRNLATVPRGGGPIKSGQDAILNTPLNLPGGLVNLRLVTNYSVAGTPFEVPDNYYFYMTLHHSLGCDTIRGLRR